MDSATALEALAAVTVACALLAGAFVAFDGVARVLLIFLALLTLAVWLVRYAAEWLADPY